MPIDLALDEILSTALLVREELCYTQNFTQQTTNCSTGGGIKRSMTMSIIVRSVKIAHILGIFFVASISLYNLSVKSEQVEQANADNNPGSEKIKNAALTVVKTSNEDDDEDDGIVTVEANDEDDYIDESLEEFKPTDEWQEVKKGQKIPAGLHVRMDMQTGEKEAKRMKKDSGSKMKSWDAGENIGIINTEKKRFTRDELKAALKDFKYKDDIQETKDREEKVKEKFRSYEDLKKEMKNMHMAVKTEGEIVTELVEKLKRPNIEHEQMKPLLVDLEYYLHQIDNAQLFCDLGGMKTIIVLLNNTHDDIREATAHTLGASLQSNAKVQVNALDAGVMQQLLKIISVDSSYAVRKKALFALSTLLRQFPFAQKKFLDQGGLSALAELFISSKDETMQIKIITLLTDLLGEYDFNVKHIKSENEMEAERTRQYQQVQLRESMSTTGWCSLMTSLLHSPSGHDSVEKVVFAMSALVNTCKDEFTPARPKLQALMSEYQELAQEEIKDGSDDFFASIYSTIQGLVSEIHREDL